MLHLYSVRYLLGLPQYHTKVFNAVIYCNNILYEMLSECTLLDGIS